MRRRLRHHVNPLSGRHLDTGARRVVTPTDRPLEVELGCAEGDFLFARCEVDPSRSYVGVEIRAEHVRQINEKVARGECPQVQAVYANLLTDLPTLFAPGSIDVCHINFPDPFFKRSQHKRRFLGPELAGALEEVIRPGGVLAFQSDIWDLALEALEILETYAPRLTNACGEWRFARHNPFGARSRRERWCTSQGIRIWRVRFDRR